MKKTAKAIATKAPTGLKVESSSRHFTVITDEPIKDGGTDEGMNPVELLLNSLASCMTIAAFYLAPSNDIQIESFSVEVEGDVDSDGFMGINPDVRNGLQEIRITPHIKCDADEEKARQFVKLVERRCPVHDSLEFGVPVVCTDIVIE